MEKQYEELKKDYNYLKYKYETLQKCIAKYFSENRKSIVDLLIESESPLKMEEYFKGVYQSVDCEHKNFKNWSDEITTIIGE